MNDPAKWLAGSALGLLAGASITALVLRPMASPAPAPDVPASPAAPSTAQFSPPLAADAPDDEWGNAVRLGEQLITETSAYAPAHVGNALACRNCHLDAGRRPGAAPLWAAFVNFPAYRAKNQQINSFQKRVQDCFVYSLNGKPPALGGPELLAIEAYAAYMASGLPLGLSPPGRGFPRIAAPALTPDDTRGAAVFAEKCSACHGEDGAGQLIDGEQIYPPLWGARSYNWGAGMATIDKAAAFIHANMPPIETRGDDPGLSVQQAWDVAHFIDGHHRPQDPRFTKSPALTRSRHHDQPYSRYAQNVRGETLGDPALTPPSGHSAGS